MRVVALEEHFTVPALVRRIDPDAINRRGFRPRTAPASAPNPLEVLPEINERRLQSMDEAGITVQVLSNTGPGPDLVPGPEGTALAREMNDHLAAAIARYPDRFAGFAVLPMQSCRRLRCRAETRCEGIGFCWCAHQWHDGGALP